MQPYNGDHHFSYFQCCCHPRTAAPSCPQTYEPKFQTQVPIKKPFISPFSIESLLGGETHQELVPFSSIPAKKDTSLASPVAAKLKGLEECRRSNNAFVAYSFIEKPTTSTTTELHTSRQGESH